MRFLIFFLFVSGALAKTYDLSERFGGGLAGGTTHPIGTDNEFNDAAREDWGYNFHLRYHMSKEDSFQLNYTNLDFEGTPVTAHVWDLLYLNRLNEVDRLTPVLGVGAGLVHLQSYDPKNLKVGLRARFGMEYAFTDDVFASLTLDYHFINKLPDDDDGMPGGEIHVLSPQIGLTWYWGHDKEYQEEKKPPPAVDPGPTEVKKP